MESRMFTNNLQLEKMDFITETEICRLCANPDNECHPIFDTKTNSILQKIHNCLPIAVNSDDELPAHICNACLEALNVSDKLRSQCLLADSILRKQLRFVVIEEMKQEKDPLYIDTQAGALIPINDCQSFDWMCEFCGCHFKSSNDLRQHQSEERDGRTFVGNCVLNVNCNGFDNSIEAEALTTNDDEFEQFNEPTNDWMCEFCGDDFNSSDDLYQHRFEVHDAEKSIENYAVNGNSDVFDNSVINFVLVDSLDIKYENILREENTDIFEDQTHLSMPKEEKGEECDVCNIRIEDEELIQLHKKFHRVRSMFCNHCQRYHLSPYDLFIHKKTVHHLFQDQQMMWFCDQCDMLTDNPAGIKTHLQQCLTPKFSCNNCDGEFVYKNELLLHHTRNHRGIPIQPDDPLFNRLKCPLCDKYYFERNRFERHMKIHQMKKNKRFKCLQCEKIFSRSQTLKIHIVNSHIKPFQCNICERTFQSESAVRLHERRMHCRSFDGDSVATCEHGAYVCETCGKESQSYNDHSVHREGHQLRYFCHNCDGEFTTKKKLRKHMLTHQD